MSTSPKNNQSRPRGQGKGKGQGRNRSRRPNNNNNNQRQNNRRQFTKMPRKKETEATGMEKFLHTITFGLLGKSGKPTPRPERKPAVSKRTDKPTGGRENKTGNAGKAKRTPQVVPVSSGRLYVGNLSYDATEEDLTELFGGVGTVAEAEIVCHSRTQRSKGYAFVEMSTTDEAQRAVKDLHDKEYMGRKMVVSGAKKSQHRKEALAE